MSVEKTFSDFMILHEKKLITKGVNSLQKDINDAINRATNIEEVNKDNLNEISSKLVEGIKDLKKLFNKHNLYEL